MKPLKPYTITVALWFPVKGVPKEYTSSIYESIDVKAKDLAEAKEKAKAKFVKKWLAKPKITAEKQ